MNNLVIYIFYPSIISKSPQNVSFSLSISFESHRIVKQFLFQKYQKSFQSSLPFLSLHTFPLPKYRIWRYIKSFHPIKIETRRIPLPIKDVISFHHPRSKSILLLRKKTMNARKDGGAISQNHESSWSPKFLPKLRTPNRRNGESTTLVGQFQNFPTGRHVSTRSKSSLSIFVSCLTIPRLIDRNYGIPR